ncbi:hypothetical protein HG535_0E01600 [Zygotorulaspora mrakii]|uniref:tRNA-dihydrouridine(16/17) synthase [NAD(P)(+)] n=1 Tax=Zygotorulaspora mrakii TaxID=42260 RepID=A0A7H9B3Q3_ZYGMR|nr:uncharacterized protein HG535_0E01600 [Zygotorulaspora mrakii]QLG73076.1 hypothetical protein HG535_0E01600 [Zygotorulaspora mrakii]
MAEKNVETPLTKGNDVKVAMLTGAQLFEKIGRPTRIVAPMVDQSELAWRILSRKYGATLAYTPMFHAKLFATSEKYRRDMWCDMDGNKDVDRPLIVQFCANDPEYLLSAAKIVQDRCDAVDLNLGCPQGIAKKGHYGAFLMDDWDIVHALIKKLHDNLDVPVTAKIRVFPEKEKTLEYAKMILDAGAQFLTVHGRLREQKGQKTGLADWDIIKYLRESLPPNTVFFSNGNILYPEDITRSMEHISCDAIMSAEGNLYNPGIFNAASGLDKEKSFPRVDIIAREYFEIVKEHQQSQASKNAMKSHMFKVLRPFLTHHIDIRAELASLNAKTAFEVWEEKLIRPVEDTVQRIFQQVDIEQKDEVFKGDIELWGGAYYTVPYWRCQPYFRKVDGLSADKRITKSLEESRQALDCGEVNKPDKKRKPESTLERPLQKEGKV